MCLPRFQVAFTEGIHRFWKTPVKAPWEAAVDPIFIPALNTKLLLNGELLPMLSTIVMPGNTFEPNALIPTCPGSEWLANRAVNLFADKTEHLRNAETGSDRLGVCDT